LPDAPDLTGGRAASGEPSSEAASRKTSSRSTSRSLVSRSLLSMPPVGEGEMVIDLLSKPHPSSRQATPSHTSSGMLSATSARSDWSTPTVGSPTMAQQRSGLSSFGSSNVSSVGVSNVPSPSHAAVDSTTLSHLSPSFRPLSSHASGALSRLLKLDSDLMGAQATNTSLALSAKLAAHRRMSQPVVALPSSAHGTIVEHDELEGTPDDSVAESDGGATPVGPAVDIDADGPILQELYRRRKLAEQGTELGNGTDAASKSQSAPITQLSTPTNAMATAKVAAAIAAADAEVAASILRATGNAHPMEMSPVTEGSESPPNATPVTGESSSTASSTTATPNREFRAHVRSNLPRTQSRGAMRGTFSAGTATTMLTSRHALFGPSALAATANGTNDSSPMKRPESRSSSAANSTRHSPPTPVVRSAVHRIANQALSAFLTTILRIATDSSMLRWRSDPSLQARMSGYNGPSMGFGLHVGWAIEGAIGSAHKIDASYLSPNVNLAARLCSATRQYRIPFLFSGAFYKLLDPPIQKRCRHLDQVTLKGSSQPIDLYTFDICPGWKRVAAAAVLAAAANVHGVAVDPDLASGSSSSSAAASESNPPLAQDGRPSTASSAPSAAGVNYPKMRAEWLAQMDGINVKALPKRRHSLPNATHETAAAAATASAAAEKDSTDAVSKLQGSPPRRRGSHTLASLVSQPNTPSLPAPSVSTSTASAAPGLDRPASGSNASAAAGAASSSSAASQSNAAGATSSSAASSSTTTPRKNSNPDVAADVASAALIAQLNSLLAQLQCDLPDNYVPLFNQGIRAYINGDWASAGRYLVQFQTLHRERVAIGNASGLMLGAAGVAADNAPSGINGGQGPSTVDGPSNLILQFMGKHAFQAPKGWKGYRKLEKK